MKLFGRFCIKSSAFFCLLVIGFVVSGVDVSAATVACQTVLTRSLHDTILSLLLTDPRSPALFSILLSEVKQVRTEIIAERDQKPEVYAEYSADMVGMSLSSPARELIEISDALDMYPEQTFVDVGTGHGIPSVVLGLLNPEVKFIGYDVSAPKILGAQRLAKKAGVKNAKFIEANFADKDFKIAPADFYYFFNPASREAVKSVSEKIIAANRGRRITIIAFHYPDVLDPFVDMGFKSPVRIRARFYTMEINVPR
jgi:hypothetical protein